MRCNNKAACRLALVPPKPLSLPSMPSSMSCCHLFLDSNVLRTYTCPSLLGPQCSSDVGLDNGQHGPGVHTGVHTRPLSVREPPRCTVSDSAPMRRSSSHAYQPSHRLVSQHAHDNDCIVTCHHFGHNIAVPKSGNYLLRCN